MKSDNKMKILTREHQWVDATFDCDSGYITDSNGARYNETNILSIENDVRGNYVRCSGCGKFIRNTPKEIEKHKALGATSDACLTCRKLKESNVQIIKRVYTKAEDGSYVLGEKRSCSLLCSNHSWYCGYDINSDDARRHCMYARCVQAEMLPATNNNIFTKYPGVLDDIVTADALDPNVWTYEYKHRNQYVFRAKSRYRMYAYVNPTGIIDRFVYNPRGNEYEFLYSKKYQKAIWMFGEEYRDNNSYISQNVQTQLMRIIADIYNKEN